MDVICTPGRFACPGVDPMWPASKRTRAVELIEAVRRHAPQLWCEQPGADVEDFYEFAARIEAVATAFGPERAWFGSGGRDLLRRASDGVKAADHHRLSDAVRFGPRSVDEEGRHAVDLIADAAWLSTFGGRACMLGTVDSEAVLPVSEDALGWLVERGRLGERWAIAKVAQSKQGVWRIPLSDDPARVRDAFATATEWTSVRLDGIAGAWLMQQWLPLRYEYRVFVVDREPITGAGCIEEHTPLDHRGGPFDTAVRERRGNGIAASTGTPITLADDDTIGAFVDLARDAAAQLPVADAVIDVALGPAGPVVVEANALGNAGLYASDPRLVAAAIATRGARR